MTFSLLCLILACVCFFLGAFNVPRANWLCAGLGFVVLSWIVAGSVIVHG
jgi:hypothetical protein